MENQYIIRVEPYGKEVVGNKGETVLETLRTHFYGKDGQPSFQGCRRGGCAFCKAELLDGKVDHHDVYSHAALTDEDREKNLILTCQSRPLSNLTIYLLKKENRLSHLLKLTDKAI
ncbi:2Fe-2S iron-sulfur cluster-binding protein [Geobacillus proteiniphilus]|uniref:2Fe-2S iron-sulfur cluster-binding protein n=1 Tax=Geobacillus proteiniphilus TaxID=860353 RepID=A0ABY9MF29_9BACL|nr:MULTISPECIES: 2Fe-2S iron-sulfur cluster-binding protein [Geobacillus]WMJ16244.1 2Fe-2S iron-sulfur cluster-binding protein [Geobacillus proteiniphilus]